MIEVTWADDNSKNFVDFVDEKEIFEGKNDNLFHYILKKNGIFYGWAKFTAIRQGDSFTLNYGGVNTIFNQSQPNMYIGVATLTPTGEDRWVASWRDEDGTNYFGGLGRRIYTITSTIEDVKNVRNLKGLTVTEREQLVLARIGQGTFRVGLMRRWQGRCALTGHRQEALLRASHLKPWRAASPAERLSPKNGLLLAAHVDALFDRGLLTFQDNGRLIWSRLVDESERTALNLPPTLRLDLDEEERENLKYHQREVFKDAPASVLT